MNQEISNRDSLNEFENAKLPSFLNVLTILTIIGCSIFVIFEIYGFATAKSSYEKTKDLIDSGKVNDMPPFARKFITPEMLAIQKKKMENKLPILVLDIVALALCFYGALEMRKRKKQGYTFWLIGELLPLPTTLLFLGVSTFSGFALLYWIFPVMFIIFYTVNKKYLVN